MKKINISPELIFFFASHLINLDVRFYSRSRCLYTRAVSIADNRYTFVLEPSFVPVPRKEGTKTWKEKLKEKVKDEILKKEKSRRKEIEKGFLGLFFSLIFSHFFQKGVPMPERTYRLSDNPYFVITYENPNGDPSQRKSTKEAKL